MTSDIENYEVHFGDPDMPAYRLRDLLAERIVAVPPGRIRPVAKGLHGKGLISWQ